jgi:transcription elongation factor Elf1
MPITQARLNLDKYISQFDESMIAAFNCPHCETEIHTLKPKTVGQEYDSLTICPDCEKLLFKIVDSSGNVTTKYPDEAQLVKSYDHE